MTMISRANREWANRPDDERFISLTELAAFKRSQRDASRVATIASEKLIVTPNVDEGVNLYGFQPTNWAFGQLAALSNIVPARALRKLPPQLVADNLNYGFAHREVAEVGLLTRGADQLGAATGANYGRVWDAGVVDLLISRFGDGVNGDWRVPGEFGKVVTVDRQNTTLYASDRDLFVFLADEKNRIEVPNRRNGQPGTLARGFFVWNSEVGSTSLGAAFFTFDYVCCNRIIHNVGEFSETRIRHSSGAPERWLDEIAPVLRSYVESSSEPMIKMIEAARTRKVDEEWLIKRFGKATADLLTATHLSEEERSIETVWDVSNALTARARLIPHQDARVALEREAGKLLQAA